MRAALLPTPGDPFMLDYWLRNFATWREHVDELVVLVNGATPPDVRAMVERAGGSCIVVPRRMGHDGAIDALLSMTEADHIVLCEDDAYVRHPEDVGRVFADIERGRLDFVGSPRHEDYASSPLQEWPCCPDGSMDDLRRGLWPAFLFIRRHELIGTDRRFGDRRWNVGEWIAGLERVVTPEDCAFVGIAPDYIHLDTLFGTTFQLRGRGLRGALIHGVRVFDATAAEEWVADDPPWFHVTGLSTLDQALGGSPLPDLDEHGGLWTRRLAWWMRTVLNSDVPGAEERAAELESFRLRAGISWTDLNDWSARFDPWVTWNEYAAVPA